MKDIKTITDDFLVDFWKNVPVTSRNHIIRTVNASFAFKGAKGHRKKILKRLMR